MIQRKPEEKFLASRLQVDSNVRSFTVFASMPATKFQLPDFESCSVALFASLVFMGPLPGRSQPATPARPAITAFGAVPLPRLLPHHRPASIGPAPLAPDWRASVGEPDGSISSPGFDEALK